MDESTLLSELEAALIREAELLQQQNNRNNANNVIMNQNNPPRPNPQALSEDERDYALRLKSAVEASPEIPNLNDLQYAHHALVDTESVEVALHKISSLQTFRKTYGINDTVEQGLHCLRAFMAQQSAFVLHVDVNEQTHEAIRVLDVARLNPRAAMKPCPLRGVDHHWKEFVCGLYYCHTACSPYLSSIRQGVFEIADLHSLGSHNFSMEFEYRRHGELLDYFPLRVKTIMAYNTGYFANVAWNLMKPLMNENVKKRVQLGCQVLEEDGSVSPRRLCEFYLQPSNEIAQESVLARARTLLQIRYQNEREFRLG